ncbi:hypothetical protein [Hydrogenovibrio marinus]|nr:hypothetical protein [Hydrogenovibrio marinus]BBN58882.1 hypothetical protein HVMH_0476 [Hydrogenovibrio marinus]
MNNGLEEKERLIKLLEELEKKPSQQVQLTEEQAKQLAQTIKKLLKKHLH